MVAHLWCALLPLPMFVIGVSVMMMLYCRPIPVAARFGVTLQDRP